MKLPCAVVRDLLPLYAEKMTEPETRNLVSEHLEDCPECRQKLEEIDTGIKAPVESSKPLMDLKKELRRRRLYTALVAALAVFVLLFTLFCHETQMVLIPWQSGLVEVVGPETRPYSEVFGGPDAPDTAQDAVEVLVVKMDGLINGTYETVFTDEDGTQTMLLEGWSSQNRGNALTGSTHERLFFPVPDRLIYSAGSQHQLLWGEALEGGVETLPRLALAYYLTFAAILTPVLGAAWFFLRRRAYSWIPRQAFFAPVSYVIAHLLIKGTRTESFFMAREFVCILLMALALYALFTFCWQIWLRRRRAA